MDPSFNYQAPLVFLGICVILFVRWRMRVHERRRNAAIRALGAGLGLQYAARDGAVLDRLGFIDALRRGRERRAENVLSGTIEGHAVIALDYIWRPAQSGRGLPAMQRASVLILEHEQDFPELLIVPCPMGFTALLPEVLRKGRFFERGFGTIEFESNEFSKCFAVLCNDKRFAYDICHPRMMEYLLEHRPANPAESRTIEVERNAISLFCASRLSVEDIEPALRYLIGLRCLFPEYLYRAGAMAATATDGRSVRDE